MRMAFENSVGKAEDRSYQNVFISAFYWMKKIEEQRENAGYQHFLLFP